MKIRSLGKSKIEASVVGFGSWAIGGWMWGGADESVAIDAIHASMDAGVTLIDTAPIYGFGVSESIVGKAIAGKRNKVILATKCGLVCNTPKRPTFFRSNALGHDPSGMLNVHRCLMPESIRQEVEGSLQRLNTDTIDLYQTHWQDSETPITETMGALSKLQQEGKIRTIGVSNATASQMGEYSRHGLIVSDQEKYSMFDRGIERDQLPFCRKNQVAMLAYSPLAYGLLTGKMGPGRIFNRGDVRLENPRFSVDNRSRVAAFLDALRPIAADNKLTLSQLVIAWTVHQPHVTHALCGARNRQQAKENAVAGGATLAETDLAAIDHHLAAFRWAEDTA